MLRSRKLDVLGCVRGAGAGTDRQTAKMKPRATVAAGADATLYEVDTLNDIFPL